MPTPAETEEDGHQPAHGIAIASKYSFAAGAVCRDALTSLPWQRAMQLKKKLGGKDTTKRSLSSAKTVAGQVVFVPTNNTISGHSHTRASCLQRNVFETKLVEEALTKIGDLLRIGFGEAGADIISRYARAVLLSSDAKTESNSNPLLVGSSDRNMSNLGNVEVLLPGQKGEYVHTQRYNVCTMT